MRTTKDLTDMIFRLRTLNAVISILATTTSEGTTNVLFYPEAIGDALLAVVHSVDSLVNDLEDADKDAYLIKISLEDFRKMCRVDEEERKRGKRADTDIKEYASMILADAINKKYSELFMPEEPELTDEEYEALGFPYIVASK